VATARRDETLESVRRLGVPAIRDNREAVRGSDVVVISVKPYQLPHLASEIRGFVSDKLVVSVVAGVRRVTLERILQANTVYRAMPNINIRIGMSTTALSGVVDGVNSVIVDNMFRCAGTTYWVPEEWLDVWTALVGSLPAYIAVIVDSLVLGAVSMGLPRDIAMKAVLDTFKATAEHLSTSTLHPAELRDEVTTPAGVTIEGLKTLEYRRVPAALIEVIERSALKAERLGLKVEELLRDWVAKLH
jgi:pyrroline-5-carboxylate reductase